MKKIVSSIIILLVFLTKLPVNADSFNVPEPFEIEVNEKLLKFIPNSQENNYEPATVEVYDNGELWYTIESLNPLGSHPSEFILSNDFKYLVRIPFVDQQNGLYFYEEGKLLKEVPIRDLIRNDTNIGYSETMVFWENRDKRKFDGNTNILHIETEEKTIFDYDITSGELAKELRTENGLVTESAPQNEKVQEQTTQNEIVPESSSQNNALILLLITGAIIIFLIDYSSKRNKQ